MIKVLVNGAKGKMGATTVEAINEDNELELVFAAEKTDDLAQVIQSSGAKVVVDFTTATAGFENTKTILSLGVSPVIGTSGFLPEQIDEIEKICAEKKIGAIIAPNFSFGALLMMHFSKEASKFFPHVEIIEMHHDQKADAPSGTGIKTADMIQEMREVPPKKVTEKEFISGARGAVHHDIHIHSVRLPGYIAHQQVLFGGKGESLTIRHDSMDRSSFMPGVILACKKVVHLDHLVYGLENILLAE